MTAAHGIVHEEFHSTAFGKSGGVMEMCQLWVNLPKKDKMDPPRYQPVWWAEGCGRERVKTLGAHAAGT